MLYFYLKAFHLIFLVAWFAGLFYIFRLFVYHVQKKDEPILRSTFEIMEAKLIKIIMTPAMILTTIFGFSMAFLNPSYFVQGWFRWKLLFILCLVVYHFYADFVRKRFARLDFFLTEKACRFINEIPTVLLIIIVLLVVIKPKITP
ncbi:MAG: TIGR00701 family protein [Deltaproteobacteria bacterium RIFCSPLOWO2_12_FULL_40_28]|nr:MAG: TIGR00701 family protein [Deltaproteobacteria bacterium RIFCSPHIGHO2_02_FULL_40_28]OGQ19711.1 MAG: TIGR00701 family protein [Deltaproteobacteria bacterium RIFCSPHIGHO2_12_FULL_40_32]OGQ40988.1 MAG: TIGR00701 family protein [Deltaproteobacteria bacterium RIFCSPLOWO2_02_FULL_40_36]OGQ54103.1 MAG: TIGR00701 family protein [Deltaproteobacteria bacterium RIFCSPLOWO2_12_FULL_40_28]